MSLTPRSKSLPVAPLAAPARRQLPLADDIRQVDRGWRPVYAVWEITLKCDLACRHCGSRAGRARPDELSTLEALDLVKQMADLGVREVTLIGGEAYLRDDWLEIAHAVREHGMQCTMTTGGRGVTEALAREAKAAGIQGASVSVDGLPATHDHVRALAGSFEFAMGALRAFKAAGIPTSSNTHINRLNLREVPEVFELLVSEGIKSWLMQFTVAMGRAADEDGLLLEPYQVLEAIPMLARLKLRADEARVRFWAGNNIGYFGPHENVLRASYPSGHMGSCGAGRVVLGIEANGDIKGCPSLPTTSVATFETIRSRRSGSARLRYGLPATAQLTSSGVTARSATTARRAWPAARGRRTFSLANAGTTRFATIAPLNSCVGDDASASCARRPRAVCRSTSGYMRSSRRPGPSTSFSGRCRSRAVPSASSRIQGERGMSDRFVLCGGCTRHVKALEATCPFCGDTIFSARVSTGEPFRRMAAAALAAGVATASACAPSVGVYYGAATPAPVDAGGDSADRSSEGSTKDAPSAVVFYGAPNPMPVDAGESDGAEVAPEDSG